MEAFARRYNPEDHTLPTDYMASHTKYSSVRDHNKFYFLTLQFLNIYLHFKMSSIGKYITPKIIR
jgi:hypothetical protein